MKTTNNAVKTELAAEYKAEKIEVTRMSDAELIGEIRRDGWHENTTIMEFIIELAGREVYKAQRKSQEPFTSPRAVEKFLMLKLHNRESEVFSALFLDSQHRLIQYRELFYGTLDSASVYPREVVKEALRCNAGAVIFAHNHPSGVAEPSSADRSITLRLRDALSLVDIRVLDHFVVGDACSVSMAERGLL